MRCSVPRTVRVPGTVPHSSDLLSSHHACVPSIQLHSRETRASSRHCNRAMSQQQYLMATLAVLLVSASISGATRNRLLLSSQSPPNSQTINSILSKNVIVFSFGEKTQVPVPILNGAADIGSFSTPVAPSSDRNTETSTILFACRAVGNQIYTSSALCLPDHGTIRQQFIRVHDSRAYLLAHPQAGLLAGTSQLQVRECSLAQSRLVQGVQPPNRNISLFAAHERCDHCAMLADASDSSAYVNSAAHADLWRGPGSAKIAIKHFFSNATAKTEVSRQSISFMLSCDTK